MEVACAETLETRNERRGDGVRESAGETADTERRTIVRTHSQNTQAILDQEQRRCLEWLKMSKAIQKLSMHIGRLNHVAVAVPDMQAAMATWRDVLGAEVSEPEPQEEHGVYTSFVEVGDKGAREAKIELITPLGTKSPIAGFLAKNPAGGMHHMSFEVDDIHAAMADLKAKGVRLLNETPKIGAHSVPVVFLHPKDTHGVLVELEEAKKE